MFPKTLWYFTQTDHVHDIKSIKLKKKNHESLTSTPIWHFTNRTSGARFHRFRNARTENNQKKKY